MPDPLEELEQSRRNREAVDQLEKELTNQQARIFLLHVLGCSYDEICEATGYSWTQVNRHMVKARARLRALREARDQ